MKGNRPSAEKKGETTRRKDLQAVILAGGIGTRLRPLTEKIAKSMIPVAGKPFLEHQISLLKHASVNDFVICIGYRGEEIRSYFKDGQSLGVRIRYSDDGERLLGTAGSLKNAEELLSDRFFITFGDAYPILDYKAAWDRYLLRGKIALMVVYKNLNQNARSNTSVQDGVVTFYSKKETVPEMQYIEFGVTFMSKQALNLIPDDYPIDLEILYRQIIAKNEMIALEVKQSQVYEIGSPEGLSKFREFISSKQNGL